MTEPIVSKTISTDVDLLLRSPFSPEYIGKLPKLTCTACAKSQGRVCPQHKKLTCSVCKAYISSAHIHLDFVGHADITNRLLIADPTWNWEPMALDENGLPKIVLGDDKMWTLWGWLTVGGVRRPGVGSIEEGKSDLMKQLIGDFIRNAAMRFGVGLELWSKNDRLEGEPNGIFEVSGSVSSQAETTETPNPQPVKAQEKPATPEPVVSNEDGNKEVAKTTYRVPNGTAKRMTDKQLKMIQTIFKDLDMGGTDEESQFARHTYIENLFHRSEIKTAELTSHEASKLIESLLADKEALQSAVAEQEGSDNGDF